MIRSLVLLSCVLLLTSCLRTRKDIGYERPGYASEPAKNQGYNPDSNYKVPAKTKPKYQPPAMNTGAVTAGASSSQQMARMQIGLQDINNQLRDLNGRIESLEKKNMLNQVSTSSTNVDQKLRNYESALANLEAQVQNLKTSGAHMGSSSTKTSVSATLNAFGRAENSFKKNDWKAAITEYQKYREQYPKGKDYPEATYKIGVCFQELNMKSEAKVFFQEVVSKYPSSKSSRKSKFRLKEL